MLAGGVVACAALSGSPPARAIGMAPPCPQVTVTLLRDVSTATARAGDPFEVETVERAYGPGGVIIPEASRGGGVVAIAQHADRGGKGGYLVLDVRYVEGPHGEHIPATIDWDAAGHATASGLSRNLPGLVNLIPFSGYLTSPYGYLHHGTDVTVPRATRMLVVLGDGDANGSCRMTPPPPDGPALPIPPEPTAEPSPAPAVEAPEPAPSPSGDWTQEPTFAPTPNPELPAPAPSPEPSP